MEALPTTDSNGNPVPYLSPEDTVLQLIQAPLQVVQAQQDKASAEGAPPPLSPPKPSGSKLLPLDEEDYTQLLDQATPADLEKLNLSDAELTYLHTKSKARQHGSGLAKHRWEQAYANKERLTTQPANTMPTPEGDVRYNELVGNSPKLLGDLDRLQQPPPHAGGLPTSDLPTLKPTTAQEEPDSTQRAIRNAGIGAANAIPGAINFMGNAVLHPVDTAKALVPQLTAMIKAGAWGQAEQLIPGLGAVLAQYGVSPKQAEEMFIQDPVAFTTTALGLASGVASLGAKMGGGAVSEAPPPTPEVAVPEQPPIAESEFNQSQMQQLGDALKAGMENPMELTPTPEDVAKVKANTTEPVLGYEGVPPHTNFRGPLSKHAPILYRETNLKRALQFITEDNSRGDMSNSEVHMASTPELALGQGDNRGVLLEFDSQGLNGRITQKPGWEARYSEGATEVTGHLNQQEAYQGALRSVTIKPNALVGISATRFSNSTLPRMLKAGWIKEILPDGSTKLTRPDRPIINQNVANAQMEAAASRPQDPPVAGAGGGGIFGDAASAFFENQAQQSETMAALTDKITDLVNQAKPEPFRTKGMSKPLFYKEAQKIPDVVEAAYKRMAAKGDVEGALGLLYDRGFHEIIRNPADRALFGHWQLAEQAKAIREGYLAQAKATPDVAARQELLAQADAVDIPDLKPGEAQAMANNPQIALAQQFYKAKIEPELEGWADPAKITNRRQVPSGYAKVVPVTPKTEPPLGTWVVDREGNRFQYTRVVRDANHADWEAAGVIPRKGGGVRKFGPFRKQTAQAAKRATGQGKMWVVDPREVTNQGLLDRLPKARHNQLIDIVRKYKVRNEDAARGVVEFKGHDVPVEPIAVQPLTHILDEGGDKVTTVPETIMVPKPVADIYNTALKPWSLNVTPGWAAIVRGQTQLRLIGVAEALGHIFSVTDRMTMQPGLGGKYGPIGKLIANDPSGLGAKLLSVLEVYDQHGPAFENNIRELTSQGRTRAFNLAGQSAEPTTAMGKMADMVSNPLKKAVFGFPKPGKRGFYGYETRLKSAMQDIIKREEPEMAQAELTARLNNEFATYVTDMQPQLVKILRNIPILGDAFAAAGVATTKGAVRSLVGGSALPMTPTRAATVLWRATAPIMFWGYIINKALDPEHRSPLRKGGPGLSSIRIYSDKNKTVDIPINYAAPAARGLKVFGGFDTINDIARGKGDAETVVMNTIRGMTNTGLRLGVGAAGQDLGVLATGKVPYITKSNEPLQVAELSPEHQLKANVIAMLTHAVAGVEGQTSIGENAYKPESTGMQYLARAAALASRPAKFGPPETTQEYIEKASGFAKVKEASEKQVGRLSGLPEPQQDLLFKKWMEGNVDPEMQQYSHNVFVKKRAMRRRSTMAH